MFLSIIFGKALSGRQSDIEYFCDDSSTFHAVVKPTECSACVYCRWPRCPAGHCNVRRGNEKD